MIHYAVPVPPTSFAPAVWRALGVELARVLRYRKTRLIGVRWVSLAEMRVLNRQYRKKDHPTDVLSFYSGIPTSEGEDLGDLIICLPYAEHEAKRRGIHPKEEVLRLVIHGTLHLAGYDHATALDEKRMFAVQERVLSRIIELCRLPY